MKYLGFFFTCENLLKIFWVKRNWGLHEIHKILQVNDSTFVFTISPFKSFENKNRMFTL